MGIFNFPKTLEKYHLPPKKQTNKQTKLNKTTNKNIKKTKKHKTNREGTPLLNFDKTLSTIMVRNASKSFRFSLVIMKALRME